MKKRILTIAAALILFTAYVSTTSAQSTDKCADWGYINTPEQCIDAGEGILKCPLDPTKIYCPTIISATCPGNCKFEGEDGYGCEECYTCEDAIDDIGIIYHSSIPEGNVCNDEKVDYEGLKCYVNCNYDLIPWCNTTCPSCDNQSTCVLPCDPCLSLNSKACGLCVPTIDVDTGTWCNSLPHSSDCPKGCTESSSHCPGRCAICTK